ncbi:transferrin-binding protein-like solute binding protein, partial [Psychrobacter sp. Ps3]|uniref:transferrin-binding protein-like solute binding protein n=1 Tax=Psychrobacter sp. Ps3 TaxID=2790957 RepID=UPI001EDFB3D2
DGDGSVNPGDNDNQDNPGDAAFPGQQDKKSSVVGQQYVRGSSSNFDKTASTNANSEDTGNATVVGFQTLQNERMTNIVVAQYADETNQDASGKANQVKYILGADPVEEPSADDENSIQANNDVDFEVDGNGLSPFVTVNKTQEGAGAPSYEVTGQEARVKADNNFYTENATSAAAEGNDVKVFGALSQATDALNDDATAFNSAQYLVKNASGQQLALNPVTDGSGEGLDGKYNVGGIKLNNVQYGRVTGDLDNLTRTDIEGLNYITADFADKAYEGNTKFTDVYFYRGLNETSLADMAALQTKGGVYQYAGHALMYGIDNSYNGEQGNGQSNSVAFGNVGDAIGNFVQAEYDAGNAKVTGSVYNVWNKGAENGRFEQVDLVTFNGDVVGNSIVGGEADRTYSTGNDKAAFKGSFFGKNAEELGGSFNSVTEGYDEAKWGGVFGAQQLEKPSTPDPDPVDPVVPPINAVE